MTTNNTNMKKQAECIQLDPQRKFKIKLDNMGMILYVNNYFTELTGFKIHDLILKDFENILSSDSQSFVIDNMKRMILKDKSENFIVIKGLINNSDACYYSLVRVTYLPENDSYLLEGKMLPASGIKTFEKLFYVLKEIKANAGSQAVVKYLEGLLEEKGFTFKEFVFDIVGVNDKTVKKYFELDVDKAKVKKKSWF